MLTLGRESDRRRYSAGGEGVQMTDEEIRVCSRCEGCGKIANDEDGSPWSYWDSLPVKNASAVILGIVQPLPCPACQGSGEAPPGYDKLLEAWGLLRLVVDEWQTDPMSVACFDLRIVKAAEALFDDSLKKRLREGRT